jgi:hypothetical protein
MQAKADSNFLDFEYFKSELKGRTITDTLQTSTLRICWFICEDQQEIIETNVDVDVLSFSLKALPRLTELTICFTNHSMQKNE